MIREIKCSDISVINFFLKELGSKEITASDLKNKLHQYYVYQLDGLVVGFIGYSIYYDRAEIDYLYVLNNYRFNNIGSRLLYYIINLVKGKCYNISLEVSTDNIVAINLYKKKGFECVKIITNYYKEKNGFLMVKELD